MKLKNKVALVLGGSRGIGKSIGLNLLSEGAKVVITWFDWEEDVFRLSLDLKVFKPNYMIEKINLLNTDMIPKLIRKIILRFGRLDILINNIERGGWPIVHGKYTKKQWDLEVAATLRSKQWVFEYSFPYLSKHGNGSVINFSSVAGIVGRSGNTSLIFNEAYSAVNRGISLLTETWARLGKSSVRVNEIMLGIFDSRHGFGTRGWNLLKESEKNKIFKNVLVKRLGKFRDIIKVVNFLLKEDEYMTGSIIKLDGGYTIGDVKKTQY